VADAIEKKNITYPGEYVWKYHDVQQNTGCVTCQKIARRFENEKRIKADPVGNWTGFVYYARLAKRWGLTISGEKLGQDVSSSYSFYLDIHTIPNMCGFSLFDKEIDIEGIKRWISRCETGHAGICDATTDSRTKIPGATDLRFIDVEKRCLVKQS